MPLALFDLDNTLLGGDSDYLWGKFLVDRDLVDRVEHDRENRRFYADYERGRLNILEWLRFQLRPIAVMEPALREELRNAFLREIIDPIILPRGKELVERHRARGHQLLIITATNRFITGPIAKRLGIDDMLATEPEMIDGRYTGDIAGTPCFQEGKVKNLEAWLEIRKLDLNESWFYTDSHNDLPLLERVDRPVAVDPDDILRVEAEKRGWPVISLRDE